MKTKRKPRQLTANERYLFALTTSDAKTVRAQIAAISRAGLAGKTKAELLRERRELFAAYRETQDDLKNLPAWLAAARYAASGSDWRHVPPTPAGRPLDVAGLSRIAYDAVEWGRLRKHQRGDATPFAPRVREETNGKRGWDCVTWRYADYLCVLSPDGRKIAVQADRQHPIEIHAVYRRRFKYRRRIWSFRDDPQRYAPTARDDARRLQRHGFDARCVRQDDNMLRAGSGESTRIKSHKLYCVVPDGLGGWYHVSHNQSAESVRTELTKRQTNARLAARNAYLDAYLDANAARVFVSVEDSLSVGNCKPATESFRAQLAQVLQASGELGAVTAAVILKLRNDEYTRRACRAAALRYAP